jgi:cell division protein FtsL
MTDTMLLAILIAGSAAAIAWSIHGTRQVIWRAIRRDLERHETAVFKRCARLERRLYRQQPILRYIARRLS